MVMRARFFLVLLSGALAACASLPAPTVEPVSVPRQAIRAFSLDARLAITRGDERVTVGLAWEHEAGRDEITLRSPIGQTLATLFADSQGARLEASQREPLEAPTLEALAERALGMPLPFSALPEWVLGRSVAPYAGERDALGRWKHFQEAGWQVVLAEYQSDAADALPRRIDLARGEVRVRMVLDQWMVR
ncbi:MAG: hypothetical protein RIR70_936 [Pseudomonadota bacterium]|jgi:outer membrane lipoprotein LolB